MMTIKNPLPITTIDSWLEPSSDALERRYERYTSRLAEIETDGKLITDYANAHLYYGFNYDDQKKGWWFREWLPKATEAFVYGDFNNWNRTEFKLERSGEDCYYFFSDEKFKGRIKHGGQYKIYVHGINGFYERIPAYARYVVEDVATHNFSAQIWMPNTPFNWTDQNFTPITTQHPLIYEVHIGMAQEQPRIGLYSKFTRDILPRIKSLGYNTIQIMAIAEHPYYGSFGYQVSNFFAPSSRFGTPDDLKTLINTAHENGISVIMDLVHSHYVNNFNEGLNELDGSPSHYSVEGERGDQKYWGSKTFDYGKHGVEHFLLSNIKYWLEEFHFDGFRFDGVTSMLYHHHGYVEFDGRDKFFSDDVNEGAVRYLTLANKLIKEIKPNAISIAEDVSGMPGITVSTEEGGIGFDFRMGMAIPDFWIEYLEDVPDEQWDIWKMWQQMTNRLHYVKTICYAESHDQAMVGDKTLAFRLMDKEMYWNMGKECQNVIVDRGIALHKMIRLFTISTAGQGYLTFMGNEFGHPQWIDFPREGNDYSYEFARRQWSLPKDKNLRYHLLEDFDKAMINLVTKYNTLGELYPHLHQMDEQNKTMVYSIKDLVFIFNWHCDSSIPNYTLPVLSQGEYVIVLNSDDKMFGGFSRINPESTFFSNTIVGQDNEERYYIDIYNVSRSALVLTKKK